MSEFIYILENPSMPGIVKIGRTDRNVSERASELSSHTGVPTEFIVVKEFAVFDAFEAEKAVHTRLREYRVSSNREFFRIDAEDAAQIIESLLGSECTDNRRDFQLEEKLVTQAIPAVLKLRTVRPRVLEQLLGIEYETALFVISILKDRGVLNEQNELCGEWQLAHERALTTELQQREFVALKVRAEAKRRNQWTAQVKEAVGELQDPETGEAADIAIDFRGETPSVVIRGSNWVTSEAQRRLANFSWPESTVPEPEAAADAEFMAADEKPAEPATTISDLPFTEPKPKRPESITVASTPLIGNYQLPPLEFLQHPDMTVKPTESR